MADEPLLAPVIELLAPMKQVRRCSACKQVGHRSDSSTCPKATSKPVGPEGARPRVDPGPLVDRLMQEIAGYDVYIADHELALDTIERRLADACERRAALIRALEAAQALDSLFPKERSP